jgi:hypothetical protein
MFNLLCNISIIAQGREDEIWAEILVFALLAAAWALWGFIIQDNRNKTGKHIDEQLEKALFPGKNNPRLANESKSQEYAIVTPPNKENILETADTAKITQIQSTVEEKPALSNDAAEKESNPIGQTAAAESEDVRSNAVEPVIKKMEEGKQKKRKYKKRASKNGAKIKRTKKTSAETDANPVDVVVRNEENTSTGQESKLE